MKCLTETEQSQLLTDWSVPKDPYRYSSSSPTYYKQFYPPKHFGSLLCFISDYLELFGVDQPSLIAFTDWSTYRPHEMALIDQTRLAEGETRPLNEASGHLFELDERDKAIAAFSIGTDFGWSSYLYLPDRQTILYNWEGDIMDFWTNSADNADHMSRLLARYELKKLSENMQNAPPHKGG